MLDPMHILNDHIFSFLFYIKNKMSVFCHEINKGQKRRLVEPQCVIETMIDGLKMTINGENNSDVNIDVYSGSSPKFPVLLNTIHGMMRRGQLCRSAFSSVSWDYLCYVYEKTSKSNRFGLVVATHTVNDACDPLVVGFALYERKKEQNKKKVHLHAVCTMTGKVNRLSRRLVLAIYNTHADVEEITLEAVISRHFLDRHRVDELYDKYVYGKNDERQILHEKLYSEETLVQIYAKLGFTIDRLVRSVIDSKPIQRQSMEDDRTYSRRLQKKKKKYDDETDDMFLKRYAQTYNKQYLLRMKKEIRL